MNFFHSLLQDAGEKKDALCSNVTNRNCEATSDQIAEPCHSAFVLGDFGVVCTLPRRARFSSAKRHTATLHDVWQKLTWACRLSISKSEHAEKAMCKALQRY